MSPAGAAFLAIWNDVEPGRERDYGRWHTREHVPERVGVPGILEGRRYVGAATPPQRYFTLYDLERLEVLESPAYRRLIEAPTPATRAMRPSFRNFRRLACRRVLSLGLGVGGVAIVWHWPQEPQQAAPEEAWRRALEKTMTAPDLVCVQLGFSVPVAPMPLETEPQQGRAVLLLETTPEAELPALLAALQQNLKGLIAPGTDIFGGTYALHFLVRHPGAGPRAD